MRLVVRQISGLGNQMFQYAAGRYYSARLNAEMILAIDPPHAAQSYGFPRPFLLSSLSIRTPYRTLTWSDRLLLLSMNRRFKGIESQIAWFLRFVLKTEVVSESISQRHCFIPTVPLHDGTQSILLVGYWQVHQIADALGDELREEFTPREKPTGKNLELVQLIQSNPNAVSLHIRRGDYLLEQEGNVALPLSYYAHAIEELKKSVPTPTFFVFSDDIEFAKANLPLDDPAVFVDHNDSSTAHEDLRLMSSCSHHIIANSSFSWWGAWLNPRKDKKVFAPRNWMVGQLAHYDELFPANWHLID